MQVHITWQRPCGLQQVVKGTAGIQGRLSQRFSARLQLDLAQRSQSQEHLFGERIALAEGRYKVAA